MIGTGAFILSLFCVAEEKVSKKPEAVQEFKREQEIYAKQKKKMPKKGNRQKYEVKTFVILCMCVLVYSGNPIANFDSRETLEASSISLLIRTHKTQ